LKARLELFFGVRALRAFQVQRQVDEAGWLVLSRGPSVPTPRAPSAADCSLVWRAVDVLLTSDTK